MQNIEEKFHAFLTSKSSSESIDDFPNGTFPKKKADYLVYSRSLIFEVKHLISDRSEAIRKKFSELAQTDPDFPKLYGSVSAEDIINAHKNSKKFREWAFDYAGRTVRDNIKSANEQIHDTKKALNLSRSTGVLVLLNEGVPLYDNQFITSAVGKYLNKKRKNGELERPNIEIVWYINEIDASRKIVSGHVILGPNLRNNDAIEAFNMLSVGWSAFNGYAMRLQ